MAEGFPVVIRDEASQSYVIDIGPNYSPFKRLHRIVKQDGQPYCLICRDGRCSGTKALRQWRRDNPKAPTLSESKPEAHPGESLREWLERRVAALDHKRHIEWQPRTELERYWAQVGSELLKEAERRERAGRAEYEQYQLWTKGRGQ